MYNFKNFNNFQLDVLKEVSTIGAGNAATSLSQLLQKRISMTVPKVKVLEFGEVGSILGNEEDVVAGVVTPLTGSIQGMILFILKQTEALNLLEVLTNKRYQSFEEFDEVAISAIRETGSILSGTYISALSGFSKLDITCLYPNVSLDMAGAVLSLPAISIAGVSENILYIDTGFVAKEKEETSNIQANLFLVPDAQSFRILLNALGVTNDE